MNNVNNDKIEIWNCKKTVTTFVKEIFCSNSFFWNFFKYIKKSKDSSAKYYQAKKACERYQSLPEEEKEKKATIWWWTIQKSLRRWKAKTNCVKKKT